MCTNGANRRSLETHYKVTAVAALPHGHLALSEYLLHLNVVKKSSVSLLVRLLDSCYCAELECDSGEALFLCLILFGYVAGIASKLVNATYMANFASKWYILFFYVLNFIMVAIDTVIYVRNYRLDKKNGVL